MLRPSQRSHRRRLIWHIAILVGVCSLPLAGLAYYFLATGLHREISVADTEHHALKHMGRAVSILGQAVELSWSEAGDDQDLMLQLGQEIETLDNQQGEFASAPKLSPAVIPSGRTGDDQPQVRKLWDQVRSSTAGTSQRNAAIQQFVSKLHENIFQAGDASGLGAGPESEIGFLSDIVTVGLPLHVERLMQMHERMEQPLRERGWDLKSVEAAAIFARELDEEDAKRFARNSTSALAHDRSSAHVLASFQDDYPKKTADFLSGIQRLSSAIRPIEQTGKPSLAPDSFDHELRLAFTSAMEGWTASIEHLDGLILDQIHEAQRQRDHALFLGGILLLALLPATWLYFVFFVRPLIRTMIEETVEHQRAAEAAREAADESSRRLKQTQEAMDDHCAVFAVDREGRFLSVNDRMCELCGYSRGELLARPATDLVMDEPPGILEEVKGAVIEGCVWAGSLSHKAADGTIFWADTTIFPFRDRTGTPVEFIVIETNITELVQARKAAEDAVKAKSQFLAMMSHEIRTPMNGVLGFANLLSETRLDDRQREYARAILTSGESLLVIINDILDFSKLEAGKTELEFRPLILRSLVEDVLDMLSAQARSKQVELAYYFEPDVPEAIEGDELRLRQVLLNLAGNALKFTSAGHVEIAIGADPSKINGKLDLTFHIRDTGIGIPRERQERLFKAFSQIDPSIARTFGGTGLGLIISQRLVGLMGGLIGVESEPGEGSDFYFTIPVAVAEPAFAPMPTSLEDEEIEESLRGRHILIVDDLPANQHLFEDIFAHYGASTVICDSPEEARVRLDLERFDLAVLDYEMPSETGVELARSIREKIEMKALPLILATSVLPQRGEIPHDLFAEIIPKPIHKKTFVTAAARAITGRALPKRLEAIAPPDSDAQLAVDHPLRIVVVDDSAVNLRLMTLMLRGFGYEPSVFGEAEAALAYLKIQKADLVLMDVQMPGLDGHEATRQIRAGKIGELNQQIPIVALSAGAMEEERSSCRAAGMNGFLAKPLSRKDLLAKIVACASAQPLDS